MPRRTPDRPEPRTPEVGEVDGYADDAPPPYTAPSKLEPVDKADRLLRIANAHGGRFPRWYETDEVVAARVAARKARKERT